MINPLLSVKCARYSTLTFYVKNIENNLWLELKIKIKLKILFRN